MGVEVVAGVEMGVLPNTVSALAPVVLMSMLPPALSAPRLSARSEVTKIPPALPVAPEVVRSEDHTSELQSLAYAVCPLLLGLTMLPETPSLLMKAIVAPVVPIV